MGLFLNQHVNYTERKAQGYGYDAYNNGYGYNYGNNCSCGKTDYAPMFINMGVSLFSVALQALDKGDNVDNDNDNNVNTKKSNNIKNTSTQSSTPSEKDDSVNAEIQAEIDRLNANKTEVLKNGAGVDTLNNLNSKINSEYGNLNQLENSVKGENSVESLNEQLLACYDENNNLIPGYENRVNELNGKLTDTQNKIKTEIPEKKLEISNLETIRVQVENINQQIEVLEKKKEDNTDGYSIAQETQDINSFMNALKEFQKNPTNPSAAQALKQAYEQDSGNGHTSVQKAWDLVSDKVTAALSK